MRKATKHVDIPNVPEYSYMEGRHLIQSGDIISFFSSHEESFWHRFTTEPILFFTGSHIYHTGIAIWINVAGERRLMLAEAVGVGRRLLNLSHFQDRKMEVHHRPDYVDQHIVESFMMDGLGEGYAFGTLITIGAQEFFTGGTKPTPQKRRVCSQVAADAWNEGGMNFDSSILSPGRLRNVLIEKGIPPSLVLNPHAGY